MEYSSEEADDLSVSNNFTFTEGGIDNTIPDFPNDDLGNKSYNSTASSPFITNPEMINIHRRTDSATSKSERFDNSNLSINMDQSIISLRESLKSLKVTQPNESSIATTHTSNENHRLPEKSITMNSDTSGFNFTNNNNETKYLNDLKLRNITGTKKQAKPWQTFRTSTKGSYQPQASRSYRSHNSVIFGHTNPIKNGMLNQEASSSLEKIDELNKEITGYKIQIKFLKQFLQRLMDQNPENYQSNISFHDLSSLHNIEAFPELDGNHSISKLKSDYDSLLQEYNEIYVLNEDLYNNLEQFQGSLSEMEQKLGSLENYLSSCTYIANELLHLLATDEYTEEHSSIALQRCFDDSLKLDVKLLAVKLEIGKILEQNRSKLNDKGKSAKYIDLTKELISSFEDIVNEFTQYKNESMKLEADLLQDEKHTRELQMDLESMNSKFTKICAHIQQLDNYTSSPNVIEENLSNDKLPIKLTTQNDTNISNIPESTSKDELKFRESISEELLQTHKDFNVMSEEFNKLSEKYRQLEANSSRAISSLTSQLQEKQQDLNKMHADMRVDSNLKQDLDIAVEKQRILKAEKIRLAYSLEALNKEKVSMQATIKNLTDKITSLTIDNSNDVSGNNYEKQLSTLEYRIEDILLYDIQKFQKLLKSFNKIADDRSLKEPSKKVDYLFKRISDTSDKIQYLKLEDYNLIKDFHKSVFDYFTRAVDILVNDHVKLLLRESDNASENNTYVAKLHKRIDDLNKQNEALIKEVESQPEDLSTSPRSKLRIEELSNRWKAEREARVYENKEAQKRLKELELENARLKSSLNI